MCGSEVVCGTKCGAVALLCAMTFAVQLGTSPDRKPVTKAPDKPNAKLALYFGRIFKCAEQSQES
ncbi:MAG: hypothetical protein C0507_07770 [Cyanobacteria bacterium PR.3.49]|nr:hypothetical protein [Cyanobacteria bacterium PR.3.49]